MSDDDQVFEFSGWRLRVPWLVVLVVAVPVGYWAIAQRSIFPAVDVWHHAFVVGVGLLLLRQVWLASRLPCPVRAVVNGDGLTVQWPAATTTIVWQQLLEARLLLTHAGPVMRFVHEDGAEVRVPLWSLGRQAPVFRGLVESCVGDRTRARVGSELRAGQPVSTPGPQRAMRLGMAVYIVGDAVAIAVSCWLEWGRVYLSWLHHPTSRQAVMLAMWPTTLVLVGWTVAWVLRRECKEYRFTPTGLEERWSGGRRELAYADIERVIVRRYRKPYPREHMVVIGRRRKLRLEPTMTRYEAVLGILCERAPQAVVVEDERL